jgi:hypothetical protein
MTAAQLLGEVLSRARETVGRSPEQVGEHTGVHGRTIRRLEDGESESPRRTTLRALGGFYGLRPEVLMQFAKWSSAGLKEEGLERELLTLAATELSPEELDSLDGEEHDRLVAVAMRLSRARPTSASRSRSAAAFGAYGTGKTHLVALTRATSQELPASEQEELIGLVTALTALDRRRRRMATEFIDELRRSQMAERALRRRGEDSPSDATPQKLFDEPTLHGQESLLGDEAGPHKSRS